MDAASTFLQEVAEQPAALRAVATAYRGEARAALWQWRERAQAARHVWFAGMGTSEFAAESIAAALTNAGLAVETHDAGELLHYPRPLAGLPVLVSQSGESVETRSLIERLSLTDFVAITNHPESTLATAAALHLPLHAGAESAISTKTYVNTLAVLALMTQAVADEAGIDPLLDRLEALADVMPQVDAAGIEQAAELLANAGALHCIARGPALAAAKQAALTFMEGTHTLAGALTGGAFRHGPFELVGPTHHALIFIAAGPSDLLLQRTAQEAAGHGSRLVIITDRPVDVPTQSCQVLRVPAAGEGLFPIAAATTQALLLDALARRRGVTPGVFRYRGKVTLQE